MTFDASLYPAHLLNLRYVDPPRDAVPVRRRDRALLKAAIVTAAAATLLVAAIGFAAAAPIAPGRVVDTDPIRGEFRLGPGNQQPPGYIVSLTGPVPGEFRLGPGNQQPPGVVVPLGGSDAPDEPVVQWRPSLVPLNGEVSLSVPKPGDIIFAPKPPGRVPAA